MNKIIQIKDDGEGEVEDEEEEEDKEEATKRGKRRMM